VDCATAHTVAKSGRVRAARLAQNDDKQNEDEQSPRLNPGLDLRPSTFTLGKNAHKAHDLAPEQLLLIARARSHGERRKTLASFNNQIFRRHSKPNSASILRNLPA